MNVNALPVFQMDADVFRRMLMLKGEIQKAGGDAPARSEWLLLDVREPHELDGPDGSIAEAVNIPIGQLSRRMEEINPFRDRAVIIVCRSGSRAATAARILMASGFGNVKVLSGGMHAWNRLPAQV